MVDHCKSNVSIIIIYHINCVSQLYTKKKKKLCFSKKNNNNHINCEKDNEIYYVIKHYFELNCGGNGL